MVRRVLVHVFGVRLIGAFFCLLSAATLLRAEDDRTLVRLNFPNTDVRDVAAFYGRLVRKPLLADIDLRGSVTLDAPQELPLRSAVELIRKTLLEKYGIEMREDDRGEVLATWSSDPQYPHHSDSGDKESEHFWKTVRLHYTKAYFREVLDVFQQLIRKPLLVALDIRTFVTIDQDQELAPKDAVELIRKTLLEKYGIAMREDDRGEILVTWSPDSKYPHRSDAPEKENEREYLQRKNIQLLESSGNQ